jgi:hypothetical protein
MPESLGKAHGYRSKYTGSDHTVRRDQLNMEDDPGFLPEIDMPDIDLDFSLIESSTQGSSHRSSFMSLRSLPSSQSSHHVDEDSVIGLVIPTSESGNTGGAGGFALRSDTASVQRATTAANVFDNEDGFLPDIGFNFDTEGNFIDLGDIQTGAVQTLEPELPEPATRVRSESRAADAQLQREHEQSLRAAQERVSVIF